MVAHEDRAERSGRWCEPSLPDAPKSADQQDVGDGELPGMRQRHQRAGCTERRTTRRRRRHRNAVAADRHGGPPRYRARTRRGNGRCRAPSSRPPWRRNELQTTTRIAATAAIGDFLVREHAADEAIAIALDSVGNAGDLGRVEPGSYNFHSTAIVYDIARDSRFVRPGRNRHVGSCCDAGRSRRLPRTCSRRVPCRSPRSDDWRPWRGPSALSGSSRRIRCMAARCGVIRRGSPPPVERPACDALVSNGPETAVAIRAADCVPVLLADARSGAVAAVHAGWRGVAAGTIGTAVDALMREFGTTPSHIHAAIGPASAPAATRLAASWSMRLPPPDTRDI